MKPRRTITPARTSISTSSPAKELSGPSASTEAEFVPGNFLFFKRNVVHAMPRILEAPVVFLSVDTPRRDPKDIIFVNAQDGTPESFIQPK